MAASLVYSCQGCCTLSINAYVHLANAVLSRSSYVVMFILLTGIIYVLKTVTNVAAVEF